MLEEIGGITDGGMRKASVLLLVPLADARP